MKDEFTIEVDVDGTMRSMYQDGIEKFIESLGGSIQAIGRASHIEWEDGAWVVRSAKNPHICIRDSNGLSVSDCGPIARFSSKAEAYRCEEVFFWQLYQFEEVLSVAQHCKDDF